MAIFTQDQLNKQISALSLPTPTIGAMSLTPPSSPAFDLNPIPKLIADGQQKGLPTHSNLARGVIKGTTIASMNDSLEHACDFALELKKDIGLKKFIRAIAKDVREGIRYIMKLLGLSDWSGEYSFLIGRARAIAQELRRFMKEYIQPVLDFEKYVLAVLVKIKEYIQWILSLPAKIMSLLQECLQKLMKLLSNLFTDALAEAAGETPLGVGDISGENGLQTLINEVKTTLSVGQDVLNAAKNTLIMGSAIVISSTVGILNPVSAADLTAANATIANYTAPKPFTSVASQISTTTNSRP